jgi:30S ribosomal protein S31
LKFGFSWYTCRKISGMGKGDKKSKRGKLWKGTYGVSRSRKAIKARLKRTQSVKKAAVVTEQAEVAPKVRKVARKKTEQTEQ